MLERSAWPTRITTNGKWELDTYTEEGRTWSVEEGWKRGRDTIRKPLVAGTEERRRKAREWMEGEGNVVGSCVPALPYDLTNISTSTLTTY